MRKISVVLIAVFLFSCEGPVGPPGPQGPVGPAGPKGETGTQGPAGATLIEDINIVSATTWFIGQLVGLQPPVAVDLVEPAAQQEYDTYTATCWLSMDQQEWTRSTELGSKEIECSYDIVTVEGKSAYRIRLATPDAFEGWYYVIIVHLVKVKRQGD